MTLLFVTTGTQFPFDRLLSSIDTWAGNNQQVKVVAQTCESSLSFEHLTAHDFLSPEQYKEITDNSSVIVSHAGMGTIITAHETELPIIIMPRLFSLNEHRNDHQLATVKKFRNTVGVYVAENEDELFNLLNNIGTLIPCKGDVPVNRSKLISFIKANI